MVVAFKIDTPNGPIEGHEPPYTEEEEMEAYRRMAGGPVQMTSVTRKSGPPPVSTSGSDPGPIEPSNATKPVTLPEPDTGPAELRK